MRLKSLNNILNIKIFYFLNIIRFKIYKFLIFIIWIKVFPASFICAFTFTIIEIKLKFIKFPSPLYGLKQNHHIAILVPQNDVYVARNVQRRCFPQVTRILQFYDTE